MERYELWLSEATGGPFDWPAAASKLAAAGAGAGIGMAAIAGAASVPPPPDDPRKATAAAATTVVENELAGRGREVMSNTIDAAFGLTPGTTAAIVGPLALARGVFSIGPYRPVSTPLENHHGILDSWAACNISGCRKRGYGTPTIALTKEQHAATNAVYREFAFAKTKKKVGGKVDWSQVSPREIQSFADRMFDAAGVPADARRKYFRAFHQYIYGVLQ